MSSFRKRSLSRYGLALMVIAGAGLVAATSQSDADTHEVKHNYDCWIQMGRVCNWNYFPPCYQKPDGTSCYTCPYTVYGTGHCIARWDYDCQPTPDLPYDCGPKLLGTCVDEVCYGEIASNEPCTILQCTKTSP